MTKKPVGWDVSKLDIDEHNKDGRLFNFPPERRWAKVEEVLFQQRSKMHGDGLVAISGRDHIGAEIKFWTDLPNAMYLMNILAQIQRQERADVPSTPPNECKPYDGKF